MTTLISFFLLISAKKNTGFYKLSFRLFYFNSVPRIPHPYSPHSHPDSSHFHPDSLHSHPISHIPRIPIQIPRIPTLISRIPTQFLRIPTPIPCILTPIPRIPIILFPDSSFRLLHIVP